MPQVKFETTPPGATAFVNERYLGVTPFSAEVAQGELEVVFWKEGYVIARYRDVVTTGGVVGTSLEEDESVGPPPSPTAPGPATAPAVPATALGQKSRVLPWVLGLAVLGGAGATAAWWYRRRGKRAPRQLRGTTARRVGNGATKVSGLGAAATSCSPNVPGSVAVRTCITRPTKRGPVVDSATGVCKLLAAAKNADRESFFTISLDPGMRVLGVEESHKGSVNEVSVYPREVFKSAILLGASVVIIAHNHPSGDSAPSNDDIALTKRLVKAGQLVGITVMDHVVIGTDRCQSIAEWSPKLFVDDET